MPNLMHRIVSPKFHLVMAMMSLLAGNVLAAPPATAPAVAKLDSQTHVGTIRPGVLRDTFPNGVKITSFEIIKQKSHYYLVRSGTNGGNCETTATPLKAKQGTLYMAQRGGGGLGVTSASCSGDPCSSCKFTYNKDGIIVGCQCNDGTGKCNHTITSTTLKSIFIE